MTGVKLIFNQFLADVNDSVKKKKFSVKFKIDHFLPNANPQIEALFDCFDQCY